ncbi:MAG: GIY-YIG nuclease family protein [Lentisphaeria bacterium]|nr:GIY-YIG nuclease family protein [Lentisphaeria bacterium]
MHHLFFQNSRIIPEFFYTYVLICADGDLYIGSTPDLRKRLKWHQAGYASATSSRLPLQLVYYEACLSLEAARDANLPVFHYSAILWDACETR